MSTAGRSAHVACGATSAHRHAHVKNEASAALVSSARNARLEKGSRPTAQVVRSAVIEFSKCQSRTIYSGIRSHDDDDADEPWGVRNLRGESLAWRLPFRVSKAVGCSQSLASSRYHCQFELSALLKTRGNSRWARCPPGCTTTPYPSVSQTLASSMPSVGTDVTALLGRDELGNANGAVGVQV